MLPTNQTHRFTLDFNKEKISSLKVLHSATMLLAHASFWHRPTFSHFFRVTRKVNSSGVTRREDRLSITRISRAHLTCMIACTVRINGLQNKSNAVLVHTYGKYVFFLFSFFNYHVIFRGPVRTIPRAVFGPRAVQCPGLV